MRSCGPKYMISGDNAPNQVSKPSADGMRMPFEAPVKGERYRQTAKHEEDIETKRRKREVRRFVTHHDIQKHQDREVNCVEREAELREFAGEAQE
jgi:hypothetical protein